jgi:hypothetical protein
MTSIKNSAESICGNSTFAIYRRGNDLLALE